MSARLNYRCTRFNDVTSWFPRSNKASGPTGSPGEATTRAGVAPDGNRAPEMTNQSLYLGEDVLEHRMETAKREFDYQACTFDSPLSASHTTPFDKRQSGLPYPTFDFPPTRGAGPAQRMPTRPFHPVTRSDRLSRWSSGRTPAV